MIALVIMDGFGNRKKKKGNAIALQGTPYLDKLCSKYPSTVLGASGNFVGLPSGQMGNSEAGHLTIGSGRRFYQPLERVNRAIADGSFFENPQLLHAINNVLSTGGALHVLGLVSDGGVHSHINHIKAVLKLAHQKGVSKIFVHAVLDGRDTGMETGFGFIQDLQKTCKQTGAVIKSLCGRAWAMDREKAYDRTKKAYRLMVCGRSENKGVDPLIEIQKSYDKGVTDEFFEPTIIGQPVTLTEKDSLILCNVRKDRMRQLLEALALPNFNKFRVHKFKELCMVGLVEYDDDFANVGVAFEEEDLKNGLAKVLQENGKRQLHITETSKFPHVTYYFNCGKDEPYPLEDQKMIEGFSDLKYSEHPEMRAFDITNSVLDAIASGKYDFVVVNFPNCDMVGHTADMEATKSAVRIVDKCAYAIAMGALIAGGECIITADHGNAEELFDAKGEPKTSHTTNDVPFILVSGKERWLKEHGELANIAPTILEMMGLEIPKEMSSSLLTENPTKKQQKSALKTKAKMAKRIKK